jgi:hypothetical protein
VLASSFPFFMSFSGRSQGLKNQNSIGFELFFTVIRFGF